MSKAGECRAAVNGPKAHLKPLGGGAKNETVKGGSILDCRF